MQKFVGFVDGTELRIARPSGSMIQRAAYNGHKRKHSLKYQAVNTLDGMIAHLHGPFEGWRRDWTLYVRSKLYETLPKLLEVGKNGSVFTGTHGTEKDGL